MLAKIYFSGVLLLLVLNTYYIYLVVKSLSNPVTLFQFIIQILLIIGLSSFAFKKKFFQAKIWKIIFFLALIHLGIGVINTLTQGSVYTAVGLQELLIGMLGFLILDFPAYYALYKLSNFTANKKKK